MSEATGMAVQELNTMLDYFSGAFKWYMLPFSFSFNSKSVKEVQVNFSETLNDLVNMLGVDPIREGEQKSEFLVRVLKDEQLKSFDETRQALNTVVKMHRYAGLKAFRLFLADAPTKKVIRKIASMKIV